MHGESQEGAYVRGIEILFEQSKGHCAVREVINHHCPGPVSFVCEASIRIYCRLWSCDASQRPKAGERVGGESGQVLPATAYRPKNAKCRSGRVVTIVAIRSTGLAPRGTSSDGRRREGISGSCGDPEGKRRPGRGGCPIHMHAVTCPMPVVAQRGLGELRIVNS